MPGAQPSRRHPRAWLGRPGRGILRRRARRLFDRLRAARELALLLRWPRLRPQAPDLAHLPFSLLVVHDTGTVRCDLIPLDHVAHATREHWIEDAEFEPQPGERAFVNWILDEHPEFAQIHLHTSRTLRWGLTLLQRSAPLPRPASSPSTVRWPR